MLVVADATPLNYLIVVEAADVLAELFTDVHIPFGVRNELASDDAPEMVRSWVQRAAILLAESLHADLLPIDEREGAAIA